jgi:hypothetical protein
VVKLRSIVLLAGLAAAAALFVSCASKPPATTSVTASTAAQPAGKPAGTQPAQAEPAEKAEVAALQKYLDVAYQKMDQGLISEGILNFVTILSEVSRIKSPTDDAKQFAKSAEEELNRIGSALSLSAALEWVDREKNQVSASTIDVGTPSARNPSVTLTYSYGGTKTVVSDAPVMFEFLKGEGVLVTPVTTNEYGQANTTITSIANVRAENIVRATVSYRVKGYAYTFKGASRDFAYVPPVKKASILVLERATLDGGGTYVSAEPVILDRTFNVLKKIDFQYTPYNGKLLGDQYMKVFGGENASIKALGLEEGVAYLVMVLSDAYYVKQVELNGKKYELYKSKTNGTMRVIRAADGAILYSGTVQSVDGQGNTAEKAVIDGFRATADKMAQKLDADLKEITKTLIGG